MQTQTSTVHQARSAKALALDPKKAKWSNFVYELTRLHGVRETASYETALAVWYEVEKAYRALREAWTGKRNRRRLKSHDPSLEPWLIAREQFLTHFWGAKDTAGKRHGSKDPTIAKVMAAYQAAWGVWRKRTKSYAESKARENKRRNQLPQVKAKKAAWAKTPEGQAWWTAKRADNKAKRAEFRKAQEALKDV